MPIARYSKIFTKYDRKWSESRGLSAGQDLSERELLVKEALFGTWERGGKGMKDIAPSLEGIYEYIEAKGTTVEELAAEWTGKGEDQEYSSDREQRMEKEAEREREANLP
jgi:hypothetical protein